MEKSYWKYGVAIALSIGLSGCMTQQRQPTPEELEMRNKMMQAFMSRMQNGQSAYQQMAPAQAQPAQPTREVITEAELIASIDALPPTQNGVNFERLRDGLKVNGKVYLDPEGSIVDVASNSLTGDFTYLIKTGQSEDIIKYSRVGQSDAITLAYVSNSTSGVSVETVTGKKMSGDAIILASQGFVVSRAASAFRFDPYKGVSSFSSKEGFHIAPFQNGDVASTQFILLEKDNKPNEKGSMSDLFQSFKDAGNAFGIVDSANYEYMLADLNSDTVIPLDVTLDGKEVAEYSGCKKKNSLVNECSQMRMRDSLYRPDGSKNLGHYYWKIFWFNTPEGPFSVTQEAGLRKLTITNLNTGEKVIAFERMLGINGFSVNQNAEGVISIKASLGFSSETIPDALAFFKSNLLAQQANNAEG